MTRITATTVSRKNSNNGDFDSKKPLMPSTGSVHILDIIMSNDQNVINVTTGHIRYLLGSSLMNAHVGSLAFTQVWNSVQHVCNARESTRISRARRNLPHGCAVIVVFLSMPSKRHVGEVKNSSATMPRARGAPAACLLAALPAHVIC